MRIRKKSRGPGCLWLALLLILAGAPVEAQTRIEVTTPMVPPGWALMERKLLEENTRLAEKFAGKYVNPVTGHFECVETWGGADGPDDVMENVYNWPLLYTLGAPKRTLDLFHFIWNGHLDQYTRLGMFYREFISAFDWEHNGEQYAGFNLLPLPDPEDRMTRRRMIRFADFYTGRDTSAQNYDSEHRIIRGVINGSHGPRFGIEMEAWPGAENFVDGTFKRGLGQLEGDYPLNLISTALAANAYMMTGDEHYREWVAEYVGAWRERTEANGGIIPSNVGPNGIVGEQFDGKWYEGFDGWNYWFGGWGILGRGMRIGFANGYLLTGDTRILDALRRQGEVLLKNRTGPLFLNKHGDDGWYQEAKYPAHYSARPPAFEGLFADIYLRTFSDDDLKLLYEAAWPKPEQRRNRKTWKFEYEDGHYDAGNEVLWIDYLNGNFPGFPAKALRESFERIRLASEFMDRDLSTPDTRRADTLHGKRSRPEYELPNGVIGAVTGTLVNLTMGGPQPLWSGGLLHTQLRHFDPVNRRPGLPEGVGALVTKITRESVTVTLVNTSQSEARDIVVQTGAYGEHQCARVETGGESHEVDARHFSVRLAPGAGAEFVIHRKLMANQPTVSFPW